MPTTPKNVKQPEDHKPKTDDAEPTPEPRVVTVQGNEYTIALDALDDFELLDDLNELERTRNVALLPSIMRRFLGPAQTKTALGVLREAAGGNRVPIEAGDEFVSDLLTALDPN